VHASPDPPAASRTPAAADVSFQYALLRVVPRVDRGECLNAGVVLFARTERFLRARVALDATRLAAVHPGADSGVLARHLDARARVAAGDPAAGPIARLSQSERFNWLVAPSSTAIQPSPVHTGLCADPAATLDELFERLVA
jgi:Protein of unknown function (DUF3037)